MSASLGVTRNSSAKSLDSFPAEILLQIFACVDLHRDVRIMGYIPDDPPPYPPDEALLHDYRLNRRWLNNIALTCRRFEALIPEALLHAPVLEVHTPLRAAGRQPSDIFRLILRIHEKPELSRHIKHLRLCFMRDIQILPDDTINKTCELIRALPLPASWKEACIKEFRKPSEGSLFMALLALLPQLETLCISNPYEFTSLGWAKDWSGSSFTAPVIHSLRQLKLECSLPCLVWGLQNFQNLVTLDLSIGLRQGSSAEKIRLHSEVFLNPSTSELLRNIKHLRLDFEARTMGIWDHRQRSCMSNVIRGFRNLQSLTYYAEPSAGKNPYRSVRAFPAYQANIQSYPDPPSASAELARDYWDRAIYDARTEFADYQYLVDTLVHLRPILQFLQLPGGFWTLPGAIRKLVPRFDQFTQLKTLVVPQAAIISIKLDNLRFDALFEGDFELSASMALPISLQHLKIFDVDATFLGSEWLQGLFEAQKSHQQWPELRVLEIMMGPTFTNEALGELLARRSDEGFWAMADDAAFQVVVGRDVEGPETLYEVYTT